MSTIGFGMSAEAEQDINIVFAQHKMGRVHVPYMLHGHTSPALFYPKKHTGFTAYQLRKIADFMDSQQTSERLPWCELCGAPTQDMGDGRRECMRSNGCPGGAK